MPLIKSGKKSAFKDNIRAEYAALKGKGKSTAQAVKQSVAIAYSVKRRAKKGKKRG